jgi:hypothetical protein
MIRKVQQDVGCGGGPDALGASTRNRRPTENVGVAGWRRAEGSTKRASTQAPLYRALRPPGLPPSGDEASQARRQGGAHNVVASK